MIIVFDLLVDDPYIQDYRLYMFSDHEMIIHLKLGKHRIGDYTNKYRWDVLTVKITTLYCNQVLLYKRTS